jgi:hypothetical protein
MALLILAVVVVLLFGLWVAVRKWGAAAPCFLAAAVSLAGLAGVLAERAWGLRWSWNFAHHGTPYAEGALVQGIFWLALGLRFRAHRRTAG